MAIATTPEKTAETDAQIRLRQAIADVERQLKHPSKSELSQAREDLDRRWVVCSEELRRLARPLTVRAPRVMGSAPVEPSAARAAQVQAIEHAAALLEHANHVRARANLALFQALYRGGSTREVAKRFGFRDNKAIWRHKQKHLPDETAQAVLQAAIATEARVRATLRPEIILDALWELYRRLGACCRPQALAIIEELDPGMSYLTEWKGRILARDPAAWIDRCVLKNELNQPFALYPHQREILRVMFDFDADGCLPRVPGKSARFYTLRASLLSTDRYLEPFSCYLFTQIPRTDVNLGF